MIFQSNLLVYQRVLILDIDCFLESPRIKHSPFLLPGKPGHSHVLSVNVSLLADIKLVIEWTIKMDYTYLYIISLHCSPKKELHFFRLFFLQVIYLTKCYSHYISWITQFTNLPTRALEVYGWSPLSLRPPALRFSALGREPLCSPGGGPFLDRPLETMGAGNPERFEHGDLLRSFPLVSENDTLWYVKIAIENGNL